MTQPANRKLKRGEMLFNEGDPSKSMFFVQAGSLRLFKRKGSSSIELGMIHKGEVIGEMGFLDGGARSASVEAQSETVLVEITNNNLTEQLKVLPPWLMVLLKTIVNRLRSANNKIRQLETNSTAYTYGTTGVTTTYQFLSTHDVLKICTSILIVSCRSAEKTEKGEIKSPLNKILKYANGIMGIHQNKIIEMLDILERAGLVIIDKAVLDKIIVYVSDLDLLDLFVNYTNEENMKEHSKKTEFSHKAVNLMGYIVKHLSLFPTNSEGIATVNLAKIVELEKPNNNGKEPFSLEEMGEIAKSKLATEAALKDSQNILTNVNSKSLTRMYRIQKILKEVELINDKRREQAARGAHR